MSTSGQIRRGDACRFMSFDAGKAEIGAGQTGIRRLSDILSRSMSDLFCQRLVEKRRCGKASVGVKWWKYWEHTRQACDLDCCCSYVTLAFIRVYLRVWSEDMLVRATVT